MDFVRKWSHCNHLSIKIFALVLNCKEVIELQQSKVGCVVVECVV